MSLVTWAKMNSRALGKIGLYGVGGVLIGWPVVKFGTELWHGNSVELSAHRAVFEGTGYAIATGTLDQAKTRTAVIRTGIGAIAIYAARKI